MKTDYFFFGRKYKYLKKEAKIKLLRKHLFFNFALFWVMTLAFFSLLSIYFITIDLSEKDTKIDLTELNSSQKAVVEDILSRTNPIYLKPIKSITFTNDHLSKGNLDLLGYNQRGNIVVRWDESRQEMMNTLCHEAIHSFVPNGADGVGNEFVYDLGRHLVCYDKRITINFD